MEVSKQKLLSLCAVALLGVAACASLATGVRHAILYGSHDLQWTGGQLLAHHIDPWGERLANYPHHFTHFSPPNYLHLLYLLFVPFSSLTFGTAEILWCALSIAFSAGAVFLLARFFSLSRSQGLMALFLLWMSSPFRVVLEVGQMSLFELFFFALAFALGSAYFAGTAFGISLVKYSFSPVAAVLFLLRSRYIVLLVAFCVCCLGLLGCHLFLSTPILTLAREPFQVSRVAVSPGLADIMTLSEYSLRASVGIDRAKALSYAFALTASIAYAVVLSRFRLSKKVDLALAGLACLLFFKHLTYDYVFLAIPLCYAFSLKSLRTKAPIVAGILVFWFLTKFLDSAATDKAVHLWALAFNVLLLAMLLTYTTIVALRTKSDTEAAPPAGTAVNDKQLRAV